MLNPILMKLRQSSNPQELIRSLLGNNPFYLNLLKLAEEGNSEEIENIARNMAKEKGIDFDKEFSNFKQMLGIV